MNKNEKHIGKKELLSLIAANESYDGEGRDKLKKLLMKIINGELKRKEREYLYLYVFESRKVSEIAKIKGVTKGAVSKGLKRAFGKIRRILEYTALIR